MLNSSNESDMDRGPDVPQSVSPKKRLRHKSTAKHDRKGRLGEDVDFGDVRIKIDMDIAHLWRLTKEERYKQGKGVFHKDGYLNSVFEKKILSNKEEDRDRLYTQLSRCRFLPRFRCYFVVFS